MYDTTKADANQTAEALQSVQASTEGTTEAVEPSEGELVYLPLNLLDFDSDNVRKRGGSNIDELKALIASQGVMQNLVVCPMLTKRGKPTGKYGVVAGGRRLRALRALVEEGRIEKDKEILCLIKPRDQAKLVSLAENSGREQMTGADTLLAFAEMAREGRGDEELALAFGVSLITVQRRKKLANASPKLFDMYAQNAISLEQLMALAVIDDHERQEAVWNGASEWNRSASSLKRAALGTAISATTDRLARFVGTDAYVAAGGQMFGDLFADNDNGYMSDPDLVQRLAEEKLEARRQELLDTGLAWVDIVPVYDYEAKAKYTSLPKARRQPTEAEDAAITAAQAAADAAEQALEAYFESDEEDEDDDKHEKLSAARDAAEATLERLTGALMFIADDVRARSGAVLTVGNDGSAQVFEGLLRKEDAKVAQREARIASGEPADGGQDAEDGGKLSEALCRRLTAHKTRAIQVLTARSPYVALTVLAHSMLVGVDLAERAWDSPLDLSVKSRDGELTRAADDPESCSAWAELQGLVDTCKAALPTERDELLPWLLEQHIETLTNIVSLCTALSLSASAGSAKPSNAEPVAVAVGLDMTNWWTVGADSYLRHVTKARMGEAVQEVAGTESQGELLKLKKAEAIEFAADKLAGKQWLPAILRNAAQAEASAPGSGEA